eukprot:55737-Pyramimonas_sp.AAC.1
MEWAWARIQHLDEHGGCLIDVCCEESPFRTLQSDACKMLTETAPAVQFVRHQFADSARNLQTA